MRGSIVGSGVIHALLLVVVFYVRTPISLVVPGPETVQVALLDADMLTPTPPPAEVAPPPEAPRAEVKPEEDTGVKLEPELPKKKKKPDPPRDEAPPLLQTSALPSAAVGPSGLRGDVAVDVQNFEFTYYLVLVRNRIAANWAPPAGIATGGQRVRAVVHFRIARGGEVIAPVMEEVSGMEFFDRAALRAVTLSDPLPPLPLGFSGADLGVHFGFDLISP